MGEGAVILSPGPEVGESVYLSAKAKLYRLAGYRVFLDPESQLKQNPEAWEFLFLKNPWIAGERNAEESDWVDGVTIESSPYRRLLHDPRLLHASQFSMEERVASLPYVPRCRPEFQGITVIDLNISSYRLKPGGRDDFSRVGEFVLEHFRGAIALIRENYNVSPRGFEPLALTSHFDQATYRTIYDYADIVSSCERLVCFQTGSELIACAYAQRVECLRTETFNVRPSDPARGLIYFRCDVVDHDLLPR